MTTLTPEHRAKLLASTKERAAAFLDDIAYLRALCKKDQIAAELRRASAVLRRLLVENDITLVAAPRIGRVLFCAPNNKPYYKADRQTPLTFFSSGGTEAFGLSFRTLAVGPARNSPLTEEHPDKTVLLRLDQFLTQRVLCLKAKWVNRADVIKYIANIASGVHSGAPSTAEDEVISKIRRSVLLSKSGDDVTVHFNLNSIYQGVDPAFRYTPDHLDPVLLELLATISYLLKSEDVVRLEELVTNELR